MIQRCSKDGVNTELDTSSGGGTDVGNRDVMTNTVSIEKTWKVWGLGPWLRICFSGAILAAELD